MAGGVASLANLPVKTDSNGYLQVTIGGGTIAAATITTLTTATIKPVSDSTTAIQIANAAGTGQLVVNTARADGAYVGINSSGAAPNNSLDIIAAQNTARGIFVTNSTSGTAGQAVVELTAGTVTGNILLQSQGYTTSGRIVQSDMLIDSGTGVLDLAGVGGVAFWNSNTKAGTLTSTGFALVPKFTSYNNITTAGQGVPSIYAAASVTAQTTAAASIAAYTTPNAIGDYEVSANVLVTTATTHNFTTQCTYTDDGGTARTVTLPLRLVGDTTAITAQVTAANGAVPYNGVPLHIRCKATSVITILTQAAGTYTTVTYNAAGVIRQLQ